MAGGSIRPALCSDPHPVGLRVLLGSFCHWQFVRVRSHSAMKSTGSRPLGQLKPLGQGSVRS